MRKEEILEFITDSAEKEKAIEDLTKQKIAEFMDYQKQVLEGMQSMIKDFFPAEIKQMISDYISDTHRMITVNDLLWIDTPNGYTRIQLNPNRFCGRSVFEGTLSHLPYNPKNVLELQHNFKAFQDFVFLKNELESSIEQVYDLLCEWKEAKLNRELDFLNSLPFSAPAKQERYKVTVIIEKVNQQNELDENEKVLKVVDEALRKYGSDMLSVDCNGGMLDVNICTRHSSSPYMSAVARAEKCNKQKLIKELNSRHVGYCW